MGDLWAVTLVVRGLICLVPALGSGADSTLWDEVLGVPSCRCSPEKGFLAQFSEALHGAGRSLLWEAQGSVGGRANKEERGEVRQPLKSSCCGQQRICQGEKDRHSPYSTEHPLHSPPGDDRKICIRGCPRGKEDMYG